MLDPLQVLGLAALVLAAGLILANQGARERVNALARRFCERHGLQFLDGTVALESFGPGRTGRPFTLRRSFRFEYSLDGVDRHRGTLVLVGRDLETLQIDPSHMRTAEVMPGRTLM